MKNFLYIFLVAISQLLVAQNNENNTVIDTVVINKITPIVIKKDTLVYNVQSFSEKHDETLEDVLSKMKGIKILSDGEIEVNGKVVRKVLINNKEVSDLGSALITRSLSHENIENIEIRLDEKDNKIKGSIIDNKNFVSLNINIKKDVNSKLFGKLKIDNGYNDKVKIGGITNVFSIKPKTNIHLFAESNNRGKNTINIYDIKNIGEDSFSKIFSLPTNIDDIKSRTRYHEEIYGFDNFISNDKSIFGISMNMPINEKSDIYFGSFSNYNFINKQIINEAFLHQDLLYKYKGNNSINEYNTKNKIQYKLMLNNIKIKADINYEYNNQKILHDVNDRQQLFEKKHTNNGVYFNGEIEYKISDKLGVYYNTNISVNNTAIYTKYNSNIIYSSIIGNNFYQKNINKNWINRNEIGLLYKTEKTGTHTLGYRYLSNHMKDEKISNVTSFGNNKNIIENSERTIFYKNHINRGNISLDIGADYKWAIFPNINTGGFIQKGYFLYEGNIIYNINPFSMVKLSAYSRTDEFPMDKILVGDILKDFNTIFTTRQNQIYPFYNKIYSLSYSNDMGKNKSITAIYTTGISSNLNNQHYNSGILYISPYQLDSKYHMVSINKKGRINKVRISYEIEPEAIINTSEQIINGEKEKATTYRLLMGAKLGYITPNKKIRINYYPKYSSFVFENKIKGQKSYTTFDFLSNNIGVDLFFMDDALKTNVVYRQVNFFQTKGDFKSLDIELVYKTSKYRFNFGVNNILNNKTFTIQDMDKSILNINNNSVFGRYISIGAEIKLN